MNKFIKFRSQNLIFGDSVIIDGVKVRLTQELLEDNKDLFTVHDLRFVKQSSNDVIIDLKYKVCSNDELYSHIRSGYFKVVSDSDYINYLKSEITRRGFYKLPEYITCSWEHTKPRNHCKWWDCSSERSVIITPEEIIYFGVKIFSNGIWASISIISLDKYPCELNTNVYVIEDNNVLRVTLTNSTGKFYLQYINAVTDLVYKTPIPENLPKKIQSIMRLGIIKNVIDPEIPTKSKYFLANNKQGDLCVLKHENVNYGLVYFNDPSKALLASDILREDIKYLFS